MSFVDLISRRSAVALTLTLGGMLVGMPGAAAQQPQLYSLASGGSLSVNATEIDDLSGSSWVSLLVDGSDRYALRDDGVIFKNGLQLYKLQCTDSNNKSVDEGDWVGITLFDGSLWALSQNGYLAQDGTCVVQLPTGGFLFTSLFAGPANTWSMRADGAVFPGTTFTNTFAFAAGPGLNGLGEGLGPDTMWESATVGPDNKVYAVRRDGKLIRGDVLGGLAPFPGTVIAAMPVSSTNLYADVAFTGAGDWIVLRGDGELYQDPNTLTPLIEYSGSSSSFVDVLPLPESVSFGTTDMSFMVLKSDGTLFRETGEDEIGDLPGSKYCCLALSEAAPNLDNIDNALPVVTKYTVQAISGTPVTFPILATDTDLAADELSIIVDETQEPFLTLGATWDSVARTITWTDPVKGSFKVKATVDDGGGKLVSLTDSIKVSDPDTNPDKNKSPKVTKIKPVQGLVGIPLELPILAVDPDGDTLTITVDETQEPFTLGATFDQGSNTFQWTDPALNQIGKYKIQFNVSDGIKTVKLSVTIEIVSSLLTI